MTLTNQYGFGSSKNNGDYGGALIDSAGVADDLEGPLLSWRIFYLCGAFLRMQKYVQKVDGKIHLTYCAWPFSISSVLMFFYVSLISRLVYSVIESKATDEMTILKSERENTTWPPSVLIVENVCLSSFDLIPARRRACLLDCQVQEPRTHSHAE